MFSESKVLEKLARFKEAYKWTPQPHSVEEVDRVTAWIKSFGIRDNKGDINYDDSLFPNKLKRWIQNERALCAIDASYFLTRYFWLTENEIQRFSFRSGQRAFYKVLQALEDRGVSQEIQCLKARKQGISTLIEALMTYFALYVPGARCSIASADDQKTAVMMDMMYGALEHIPWWITPTQTKDKRSGKALLQFSHIGTSIVVQSGSMRGGIGQGTTPNKVHTSECCDYTDPIAQLEEGLFKAVPSMPNVFMVLESTGNGNTGWWADQWRYNKERYWEGRARFLPLFLPWFMTPELYPTDHWIKKFPFPESWKPTPEVIAMSNKCEAYARSTPMLSDILGKRWVLPDEQKWYWQFHREEAKEKRLEKSWTRQMPCDDFEALIGENDPIYNLQAIELMKAKRAKTVDIYGIIGDGIAERHDPPAEEGVIDADGTQIVVKWKTPHDIPLEWVLMPLQGDYEATTFDPMNKVLIFKHPERNAKYSMGVDTGTGVGGDRNVLWVNKYGEDIHPDEQVAIFASDTISNVEIYAWALCLGAYYGIYLEDDQVRYVIEQRRKYGDSCYASLKVHGMTRHHHFHEYDKRGRPKKSANIREGWWTNEWSRPLLLGVFQHAVENGWCIVNDKFSIDEIEKSEQKTTSGGKVREDHRSGEHDDRKFAGAMAYFTFHDYDLMAERAKKRYSSGAEEGYIVDYSPWVQTVPNPGAADWFERFAE